MTWKLRNTALFVVIAAVGVAAYVAGRANAHGIPDTDTLAYTGVLEDTNNQLVNATLPMTLQLFSAASGGSVLCQTAMNIQTVVTNGRFNIDLPQACVAAVKANKDVWVQLTVGTDAMPRARIHAVPYAVEAAVAARVVVANGSKSLSTSGIYCGKTATSFNGNIGGLATAKQQCETTCGDTAAHMCTVEEALRSVQLGVTITPASYMWIACGLPWTWGTSNVTDCGGWTNAVSAQYGTVWTGGSSTTADNCDHSNSIACCL